MAPRKRAQFSANADGLFTAHCKHAWRGEERCIVAKGSRYTRPCDRPRARRSCRPFSLFLGLNAAFCVRPRARRSCRLGSLGPLAPSGPPSPDPGARWKPSWPLEVQFRPLFATFFAPPSPPRTPPQSWNTGACSAAFFRALGVPRDLRGESDEKGGAEHWNTTNVYNIKRPS